MGGPRPPHVYMVAEVGMDQVTEISAFANEPCAVSGARPSAASARSQGLETLLVSHAEGDAELLLDSFDESVTYPLQVVLADSTTDA